MKRIERLRSELNELVQQRGLQDSRVIRKSKQLDKLIVCYMKRIPRKKVLDVLVESCAPSVSTKQMDESKMNHYVSRFYSSLSKALLKFIGQMEDLHREIDALAAHSHLFDPNVMAKSRELDKMAMNYIRNIRT